MNDRSLWVRIGAPLAVGVVLLAAWEAWVRYAELPKYILPTPSDIASTIVAQWPALAPAWAVTLKTMLVALAAAGVPADPFPVRAADPVTPVADVLAALLHHLLRRRLRRPTSPSCGIDSSESTSLCLSRGRRTLCCSSGASLAPLRVRSLRPKHCLQLYSLICLSFIFASCLARSLDCMDIGILLFTLS